HVNRSTVLLLFTRRRGDELSQTSRAPPNRCGGRDVDDVRLQLLAGTAEPLGERTLDVREVVVRRELAETEPARSEVHAVAHALLPITRARADSPRAARGKRVTSTSQTSARDRAARVHRERLFPGTTRCERLVRGARSFVLTRDVEPEIRARLA